MDLRIGVIGTGAIGKEQRKSDEKSSEDTNQIKNENTKEKQNKNEE